MKYNILGDIHGRDIWKKLVINDCINIFVGDYFDPYYPYTWEEQRDNFLNIIQFAKTHDGTILLLGNHDLHYFHMDDHSRMDDINKEDIKKMILDNIHMFQLAYSIENKVLVTHAGVSSGWLELTNYDGDNTPNKIAEHINNLFWSGYTETSNGDRYFDNPKDNMKYFTFSYCMTKMSDYYGISPTQSPVWIRPQTLLNYNALEDYIQVVGHTQVYHIEKGPYPIWLVDCLGQNPMTLVYNSDNNEFDINK